MLQWFLRVLCVLCGEKGVPDFGLVAGKRASALMVDVVRGGSYHPLWRLERQQTDRIIQRKVRS